MRSVILVLVLLTWYPGTTFAQSPPPHHGPPCAGANKHGPKDKHHRPQCLAGGVLAVSDAGMVVQPDHGHKTKILFTEKTIFQTESGPGILDGVMPGDFVCITGTANGHDFTAQLVIFDLAPFPCPVKKPHKPPKNPPPATAN